MHSSESPYEHRVPDAGAIASANIRLHNLLQAVQRTRSVLYRAMMDGTVKNTLWANAEQNLLDYLDLEIATALNDATATEVDTEPASRDLSASLWGLVSRPLALDPSIFFKK